jgi:hypothetical protein
MPIMKKYRFQLLQIVSCIGFCFLYSQAPRFCWIAVIPWVLLNIAGVFLSVPLFGLIDGFGLVLFFIVPTILAVLARTFVQWWTEKRKQSPVKTDQPRNFELFDQWWFAVILWVLLIGLTVLHGDFGFILFAVLIVFFAVIARTFFQMCSQLWRETRNRPPVKTEQLGNTGQFDPADLSLVPPEDGCQTRLSDQDKAKTTWFWNMAGIGTIVTGYYFHRMYSSVLLSHTAGMTKNHFAAFYASLSFVSLASGVLSLRSARSCADRFMGMMNILLGVWWMLSKACFYYNL